VIIWKKRLGGDKKGAGGGLGGKAILKVEARPVTQQEIESIFEKRGRGVQGKNSSEPKGVRRTWKKRISVRGGKRGREVSRDGTQGTWGGGVGEVGREKTLKRLGS